MFFIPEKEASFSGTKHRRPSNVKASEGRFKFAVFFICCVLQVLYIFLQIPFWH